MCAKLSPLPDDDSVLMGQPLLGKLMMAFQQRYDDILDVIDDALESENMKERIWAVEQILKRCKSPDIKSEPKHSKAKLSRANQPIDLSTLTQEELWRELDQLFGRVSASPPANDIDSKQTNEPKERGQLK